MYLTSLLIKFLSRFRWTSMLPADIHFPHGNTWFNFAWISFINCYQTTHVVEVFLTVQFVLFYHVLTGGFYFWDSHYFSCFHTLSQAIDSSKFNLLINHTPFHRFFLKQWYKVISVFQNAKVVCVFKVAICGTYIFHCPFKT